MSKGKIEPGKSEVLQGTLDLMTLKTLDAMGPQHGYGLARRIEQVSEDVLQLNEGTVYTALLRLQQRGWITAEWGVSENKRKAKFYAITKAGKKQLATEAKNWTRIAEVIGRVLKLSGGDRMNAWLRALISKLLAREDSAGDFDAEMKEHLGLLVERFERQGLSPEEASRAAHLQFGNSVRLKEDRWEQGRFVLLEVILRDLGYALRTLRKNPGFTIAAALTIALGIGANVAVFSVVNATLLRPLPYKDPGQIVMVWGVERTGSGRIRKMGLSAPNFLDLERQTSPFRYLGAFIRAGFTLTGVDDPESITGYRSTSGIFPVFGVEPALGRVFRAEEERPGQDRVVVLSHGFWKRKFGSNPGALGQTIHLDNIAYTVIGVLPEGFSFELPGYAFGKARDVWVPGAAPLNDKRTHQNLTVVGRMKPGVTVEQTQREVDAFATRLANEYPADLQGFHLQAIGLREQFSGQARSFLLILYAAVGLVFLIACANAANLQLARASARRKEMGMRIALGASRLRVAGQLLTESVLLALIGGVLGVALATWVVEIVRGFELAGVPAGDALAIDGVALAYALFLALVTGVLFGFAPAMQQSNDGRAGALRSGRGNSQGHGSGLRNVLTVSQVALCMILLAGAGLLARSFVKLLRVDAGFETANILTVPLMLPRYSYPNPRSRSPFYTELIRRLEADRSVVAAGAITDLPLGGSIDSDEFSVEGAIHTNEKSLPAAQDRLATPGYFRAMGIRLIEGRGFSGSDRADAPPVALISLSLARRFFPGESPVGHRLKFGPASSPRPWATIVGVVADVRDLGLEKQPEITIYIPYLQETLPFAPPPMTLVVRTVGDPNAFSGVVSRQIHEIDKDVPVPAPKPMSVVFAASIAQRRAMMSLLCLFAGVAMLLAGVGIYGVIEYSVSQRESEIGIRMALGALPSGILRLVLAQGAKLAAAGLVIGIGGALASSRVLTTMLYDLSPTDAVTFGGVAVLILAVSLIATFVPARRAARVDPIIALRQE